VFEKGVEPEGPNENCDEKLVLYGSLFNVEPTPGILLYGTLLYNELLRVHGSNSELGLSVAEYTDGEDC